MPNRSDASAHDGLPSAPALRGRWINWLLGTAVLASVVAVALGLSEAHQFARLIEQARPAWLLLALVLQAGTYLAQSSIWRNVTRAGRCPLAMGTAYKLSLAKLFVDQALPSAGVSGTLVVVRALVTCGIPQATVFAGVIVNMIAYHGSYLFCLAVALAIAAAAGHVSGLVVAAWALVLLLGSGLTASVLIHSGRRDRSLPGWITGLRVARPLLAVLDGADRQLTHDPRVIGKALAAHLTIVLLDSLTLWVVLRSLGETAPFGRVFASLMISNFLRSISFVPSGLGTFEAASVVTLNLLGVALPAALAATLLFRLLSFWLPMLPGMLFSRTATRDAGGGEPKASA